MRHTPAGIPISRFVLEHQSLQSEADLKRQIRCQVFVIASGKQLQKTMKHLSVGSDILVEGYLNQTSFKGGNRQLCINAEIIRCGAEENSSTPHQQQELES